MANKKAREENLKKEKLRQYDKSLKRLNVYPLIILGGLVITLLLFFVKFGYIHNTAMNNGRGGTEVSFNGFNLFLAGLTENFSSAKSVYGDIAVPFYYYAKSYIESLSAFMITLTFLAVISIIVSIVNTVTKKHVLSVVLSVLNLLNFVLILIIFINALSMSNSDILPIYCSGNPACSIRSLAIFPAIVLGITFVVNLLYTAKYFKACKILK